jgi:hypothetical protein
VAVLVEAMSSLSVYCRQCKQENGKSWGVVPVPSGSDYLTGCAAAQDHVNTTGHRTVIVTEAKSAIYQPRE